MYVVTFYSFKGGVGRTMALVNVAAELAKQGRRVLMVDFDLEAPGLFDFGLLERKDATPGLVEFICDYMKSGKVPNVSDYLYQSTKFKETEDRLWVMPAGCQNGDYQTLFSSINWQDLYENKNGYLLMEDLRTQWDKTLKPDYVFIDSRTGYTDIAGICTRQLPDAVCMLFTPNKQNLTGLTKITSEIKAQSTTPGLRHPRLLYVASNIPNLDDDEQVLAKALGNFSKQLEYVKPSAIIHHYSSFALINEAVFTMEYPNNQLALQYKVLADEIVRDNFQDKGTAIGFLRAIAQHAVNTEDEFSAQQIEARLTELENFFASDVDVLFWLSRARRASGNLEEGEMLLDAAIKKGLDIPRGYLDRAISKINHAERDDEAIWKDLLKVLSMERGVLPSELLWTIKLAARIGHKSLDEFLHAPAIRSLKNGDLLYLAQKLHDSQFDASLAVELLSNAIKDRSMDDDDLNSALEEIALGSIALGRLKEALEALNRTTTFDPAIVPSNTAFNLGMAKYWMREEDADLYFFRVLKLMSPDAAAGNVNHLQCLSFSFFAVGDVENALRMLEMARKKITEEPRPNFSCWRYLEVSPIRMKADLSDMERLYMGEKIRPLFLRESSSQ